ncbi:MAG: DUF429 domain-containing protein [Synechococcales cyanobacterium]
MHFVGVDLAWGGGSSGLTCLVAQGDDLILTVMHNLHGIPALLDWIDQHLPVPIPGVIAVDAPTLIPNATGMRLPDRLAHRYFGRYDAGCYPANLRRPFAALTTGFGHSLVTRGFAHAPTITAQVPGRYQIEVFPHPAMIRLFHLSRILKYKKGSLAERRPELQRLRHYLSTVLPSLIPRLVLPEPLPEIPSRGRACKAVEDQLDSLMCAYVGAYWWYWGSRRNQVLGDLDQGYLVIPMPESVGNDTVNNS